MSTKILICFLSFILWIPSANACVQGQPCEEGSPEQVVAARKAYFKQMGQSMKAINLAIKQKDTAALHREAKKLQKQTPSLLSFFPKDTGENIAQSRAKATIWKEWDHFAERASDLRDLTEQLEQISGAGNIKESAIHLKKIGKVCGVCHQHFRQ